MRCRLALLGGASVSDQRLIDDQCRLLGLRLSGLQSLLDRIDIITILNGNHLPAVRFIAHAYILGKRDIGAAFDTDTVRII